jgi:hypothetical protein
MAAEIELDKDGGGGDPASHGETTTMSGACDTTADDGCDGSSTSGFTSSASKIPWSCRRRSGDLDDEAAAAARKLPRT